MVPDVGDGPNPESTKVDMTAEEEPGPGVAKAPFQCERDGQGGVCMPSFVERAVLGVNAERRRPNLKTFSEAHT
ncbi:MAG TPA: hypothetical protein DFR83_05725 [Deltaproteobacteria bacterium]|nr:hypothetical protein [Deltaproteobacteria bacterium]